MFGYVGSSQKELDALYNALKSASSCDECLKRMIPKHDGWHKHGWGYVMRTPDQLYHYRSTSAVNEEEHRLPEFSGEVQAIFHARLNTGGILGDPVFSHPYVAGTDRSIFYFAHNGGLNGAAGAVPNKVDSEWALDQIVKEGDLATVLPKLKQSTESALNLLLLTVNREHRKAELAYVNWYLGRGDEERDGYYQMYKATMSGGGQAVFSSTLESHLLEHITKGSNLAVDYGEVQKMVPAA